MINHWIAAILLFDFKLVHIPSDKHHRPDGLSVIVVYSLITVPTALLCQSIAPEGVSLFSIA